MTTTYLIAPAWSDQAGQCRIVCTTEPVAGQALAHYRRNPDLWREAGLMNSRGRLVCLDAPANVREDMTADQPLMAGLTYTFND